MDSKRTHHMVDRRSGFTLMELVTSMVIIAIAVTIFAQRLQISPERELEIAASELVRHLDMARARAISERQAVRIRFQGSDDEYQAWVDHDRDGNIIKSATELDAFPEFGTVTLPKIIEYGLGSAGRLPVDSLGTGEITFASSEVEFDSRGIPTPFGTRGTVYLKHRDDAALVAAVYVSGSASVRMFRFVDGDWQ